MAYGLYFRELFVNTLMERIENSLLLYWQFGAVRQNHKYHQTNIYESLQVPQRSPLQMYQVIPFQRVQQLSFYWVFLPIWLILRNLEFPICSLMPFWIPPTLWLCQVAGATASPRYNYFTTFKKSSSFWIYVVLLRYPYLNINIHKNCYAYFIMDF